MSLKIVFSSLGILQFESKLFRIGISGTTIQKRYGFRHPTPKIRYPPWLTKQTRVKYDEMLTPENKQFLEEIISDKYGPPAVVSGVQTYEHSPLKKEPLLRGEWFPNCRRSGLIGIKIGTTLQWLKNGVPVKVTLLQIVDNHVIKYIPPENFTITKKRAKRFLNEGTYGGLIVGAVNCDPQMFTKEYTGLFAEAGVMPKRLLTKFPIHPSAAIQPGTPLYAGHFRAGDYVDVSGVSIYRGFQGVMKRWGFHGMRATHGTTKTHRRGGNIGHGGEKARVWPGTKMPGVMGNKLRTIRGLKILRIDHKYNVLYVIGWSVPGLVNSFVYIHDSLLKERKLQESPRFPTYYPEDYIDNPLPPEEYSPDVFNLSDPTIIFEMEAVQKKKKAK